MKGRGEGVGGLQRGFGLKIIIPEKKLLTYEYGAIPLLATLKCLCLYVSMFQVCAGYFYMCFSSIQH